jgi:hypothetical protein
MVFHEFIDDIPLLLLLLLTIVLMVAFIELGFWVAQRRQGKPNKPQMAQVRAIMGASLGLLAFMLAFSFSMAQRHFELRTDAYLLEISAVDSAYRGADLLGPVRQQAAKELLREFVALRRETSQALDGNDFESVVDKIRQAEAIHDQLWSVAESSMAQGDSVDASIFVSAILAMINANDERLQATIFNRISPIIWVTLFLMSLLSMIIMGFQAGLTGTHSRLATWTLAVTFSAVMMLVTDLDRPRMSLFKMNQQLMVELQNRMNTIPVNVYKAE